MIGGRIYSNQFRFKKNLTRSQPGKEQTQDLLKVFLEVPSFGMAKGFPCAAGSSGPDLRPQQITFVYAVHIETAWSFSSSPYSNAFFSSRRLVPNNPIPHLKGRRCRSHPRQPVLARWAAMSWYDIHSRYRMNWSPSIRRPRDYTILHLKEYHCCSHHQ